MSGFLSWLRNPLGTETGRPSALTVFLFIGLVLVGLAAWAFIFRHIRSTIE